MGIGIERQTMKIKKICIIGLGYIGLPTAALLANRGYSVHGVDIKKDAVATINSGRIHIVEPDLDTFVKAAVDSGRLQAHLVPARADVFFICVPTPFKHGTSNFDPDMTFVVDAARKIAPFISNGNIVILESTSPVGATQMVADVLAAEGVDVSHLYIAYCPERVLPGKIMMELVENDRIVGGLDDSSTEIVANFYKTFVNGEVLKTDSKTAEMAKLVENASRDVQIAFANELSMICDNLGIDVWNLINIANHHPRVNILSPGTGVGGHCIAVDPWFIVSKNPDEARIIRKAREVNNFKTEWVIKKIKEKVKVLGKPRVSFMGIAFKPNIDDMRESPALRVVEAFEKSDLKFLVCEPNIAKSDRFQLVSPEQAIENSDLVIFLVGHRQFMGLELAGKDILDFCGVSR